MQSNGVPVANQRQRSKVCLYEDIERNLRTNPPSMCTEEPAWPPAKGVERWKCYRLEVENVKIQKARLDP